MALPLPLLLPSLPYLLASARSLYLLQVTLIVTTVCTFLCTRPRLSDPLPVPLSDPLPVSLPVSPRLPQACFSAPTAEGIFDALEGDGSPFALDTLKTLKRMSPTSIKVTIEAARRHAGEGVTISEALSTEYRLSQACYYIFQSIFILYSVYVQCEGFAKLTCPSTAFPSGS
jgi:hypothetical protein